MQPDAEGFYDSIVVRTEDTPYQDDPTPLPKMTAQPSCPTKTRKALNTDAIAHMRKPLQVSHVKNLRKLYSPPTTISRKAPLSVAVGQGCLMNTLQSVSNGSSSLLPAVDVKPSSSCQDDLLIERCQTEERKSVPDINIFTMNGKRRLIGDDDLTTKEGKKGNRGATFSPPPLKKPRYRLREKGEVDYYNMKQTRVIDGRVVTHTQYNNQLRLVGVNYWVQTVGDSTVLERGANNNEPLRHGQSCYFHSLRSEALNAYPESNVRECKDDDRELNSQTIQLSKVVLDSRPTKRVKVNRRSDDSYESTITVLPSNLPPSPPPTIYARSSPPSPTSPSATDFTVHTLSSRETTCHIGDKGTTSIFNYENGGNNVKRCSSPISPKIPSEVLPTSRPSSRPPSRLPPYSSIPEANLHRKTLVQKVINGQTSYYTLDGYNATIEGIDTGKWKAELVKGLQGPKYSPRVEGLSFEILLDAAKCLELGQEGGRREVAKEKTGSDFDKKRDMDAVDALMCLVDGR